MKLVTGVLEKKGEIDALVERFSQNWKISRMSCVDRNVMRIAIYEMLYCDDIPPKVSINEAVDVGKKFGTQESGAFINGIMDSIRGALEKEGILKKLISPNMMWLNKYKTDNYRWLYSKIVNLFFRETQGG